MGHCWMNVKVRYEKTLESGLTKKVIETILVDALSFTEAEARTIESMKPFMSGEFSVQAIKKEMYEEVQTCNRDGDLKWYKVRVAYITLDEKAGKEKKTYVNSLVQSESTSAAEKDFAQIINSTIDYEVVGVSETPIMDVFFYAKDQED